MQNLVKENFKNKHQRASRQKADGAVDVAKVRQKVENKRRGEGPCHFLFGTCGRLQYAAFYFPPVRNLFLFSHAEPLMKPEEKGSGEVSWSVYGTYIKAAGGPIIFIVNAFLFLSTTGSIAFSNWWLSHWIRQGSGTSAEVSLLHCKLLRLSAPPQPLSPKEEERGE